MLYHVLVLLFERENGLVTDVTIGTVALEGVDLAAESLIRFGSILDNDFEIAVILHDDVVFEALPVL